MNDWKACSSLEIVEELARGGCFNTAAGVVVVGVVVGVGAEGSDVETMGDDDFVVMIHHAHRCIFWARSHVCVFVCGSFSWGNKNPLLVVWYDRQIRGGA